MGPPFSDFIAPAMPLRRRLRLRRRCGRCIISSSSIVGNFLIPGLRGAGGEFLFLISWDGRRRNQEVDAAPLELRRRRDDQNPANHALRSGFAKDVIGVVLEDFTGGDWVSDFVNVPIQVDYTDQV
ncbi:unnamed protein product [Cuscuta epithymum]|uniref:Uncharacterized protein n=1 Tax=Cuscuta epithymum TaxID=186058 RepID=A0AAV0DVD0_9ASTE|nr:unnamed protein product [Cuscuta epithymum]